MHSEQRAKFLMGGANFIAMETENMRFRIPKVCRSIEHGPIYLDFGKRIKRIQAITLENPFVFLTHVAEAKCQKAIKSLHDSMLNE